MENLKTAYARARTHPMPRDAKQGATLPRFMGQSYDSEYTGRGFAAYAIRAARKNLAAFGDARAHYESTHAIRDARRVESNEAKAAAQSLARAGGPQYEAAAQMVTATAGTLAHAEREADKARAEVARARALCTTPDPDYGAGFWQGGGRHMESGDKGGHFFALYSGDVVRNIRDAGDVVRLGHTGWYDNPHGESFKDGSGLIVGVVGQLRARDGRAVFVPGWRLGDDCQGGAQFDLRAVFVADGPEEWQAEETAEACARRADSMAESVAEREKEYKTAWGAGVAWAEAGERLAAIRAEVLAVLAERRKAARAGVGAWPAMCQAIRANVESLLAERAELAAKRAELAEGDDSTWYFCPDKAARVAFCEGAGVDSFPV